LVEVVSVFTVFGSYFKKLFTFFLQKNLL
jgi:hypothetical protein